MHRALLEYNEGSRRKKPNSAENISEASWAQVPQLATEAVWSDVLLTLVHDRDSETGQLMMLSSVFLVVLVVAPIYSGNYRINVSLAFDGAGRLLSTASQAASAVELDGTQLEHGLTHARLLALHADMCTLMGQTSSNLVAADLQGDGTRSALQPTARLATKAYMPSWLSWLKFKGGS